MIPRVIHYCWFGNHPLPNSARKCIDSWKMYFPNYEIKQWDESNFDVNMVTYTAEAYNAKKYAFVSDYARFWILYNYGGLYFDTDVEIIKDMRPIIERGAFIGFELNPLNDQKREMRINPGIGLGAEAGHPFYKEMIALYEQMHWTSYKDSVGEMPTVVTYTTNMLKSKGLQYINEVQEVGGISIYPSEYFCPISISNGKLTITENTYSIHWFDQSWQSPIRKYGRKIVLLLGGVKLKKFLKRIVKLK